jgi:CRP/FNR family transcriptional regulator, nitrogen oxide reductase regulator
VLIFECRYRRTHFRRRQESVSASTTSLPIALRLKSKFLEGLAPPDLKVILAAAKERQFSANTVIVNQGESANHLFLLTKGRARLFYTTEEGDKTLLVWLTPGKVFGGGALISKPSLYLVSTEAQQESWALVWDRATIQGLAAQYPRLMQNAFLLASEYLGWHLADHVALTSHTARQRLAHLLIALARVIGQKVHGGIELDATNEELASASNISRFSVSRLLNEWERKHAVEKRRGKIVLRSFERLMGPETLNSSSSSRRRLHDIVLGDYV